ncbi:hypothetical protein [Longimicrobium sp.]|uniref:hypothetical protein n=1 Tax=Longimicrobium sp. TaxID=2029185 RepID=UPI002E34447E|nr:hypothetical protein [Longimicrobium sp.]HEX6038326.1 hypothetical protein [Longimicrobium sp.]
MNALILAVALGVSVPAPAPVLVPDYGGTWTLDEARSTNLPPFYAQVNRHTLQVAQTDARLTVDVEIENGGPQPERFAFVYALDGSETATTTRIRTPTGPMEVPTRLRARHGDDGRLHITIIRELPRGGQTITATGTEAWELAPDGRTLTVHRAEQMPQGGETRFDMVFVRG